MLLELTLITYNPEQHKYGTRREFDQSGGSIGYDGSSDWQLLDEGDEPWNVVYQGGEYSIVRKGSRIVLAPGSEFSLGNLHVFAQIDGVPHNLPPQVAAICGHEPHRYRYRPNTSEEPFLAVWAELNDRPVACFGAKDLRSLSVSAHYSWRRARGHISASGSSCRSSGLNSQLTWHSIPLATGDRVTLRIAPAVEATPPDTIAGALAAIARQDRKMQWLEARQTLVAVGESRHLRALRRALPHEAKAKGARDHAAVESVMRVRVNQDNAIYAGAANSDRVQTSLDIRGTLGPETDFRFSDRHPPTIKLWSGGVVVPDDSNRYVEAPVPGIGVFGDGKMRVSKYKPSSL